jgi:RNA polymerase sigma-70 factor (ECF subfamily)
MQQQCVGGPPVTVPDTGPVVGTVGHDRLAAAYRDHSAAVYAVACGVCGSAQAAEVTREVFVRLGGDPARFDPVGGTLRTCVVAMAHSKAIDVRRSQMSHDDRETPAGGDAAATVRAALGRLPEGECAALVVAFYGHCSSQETATILRQAEGTTKALIRSGLRRLAAALAESST